MLLARKPAPREPVYEIRHLEATENRLTWITSWPTRCTVELGDGSTVTEDRPARNNHRIELPDLESGQAFRYRVLAVTREGEPVQTEWRAHTWRSRRSPPTTSSGTVALQVTVPDSVRASKWPVTSGIPFPKGVLGSEDNVSLSDAAGKPVSMQAAVTVRWPDGSVKWLLLDFRHTGPIAGRGRGQERGPPLRGGLAPPRSGGPPSGAPPQLSRDEGRTAVYTLRYGPEVTREIAAASEVEPPALGKLELLDADGGVFEAELATTEFEESGPLRMCLRGQGHLQDAQNAARFAYEFRAHHYQGTPWVRVLLTFANDSPKNLFTTVQRLAWRLPLKAEEPAFVRQHTDDRYTSSQGEGKRWSGPVGPVHVRDLWQNSPLDVEAGPEGAVLGLLPQLKPDEYDWAKGAVDEHRLFYWFQPLLPTPKLPERSAGGYKLRRGMTKTYEVWIDFGGRTPPYDRPLMAVCQPEWYAKTKVLGDLAAADPERPVIGDYDRKVASVFDAFLQNRERKREFGQFNFGDWWGERGINWGNIEYDTPHALFLQFARTGDLRYFYAAQEAERHNRDIDTIHYGPGPSLIGKVYAHCIGHVGGYYGKSPVPGKGTTYGSISVTHTWTQGHCDHYALTGERRSLETARKIADNYGLYGTTNYDFGNCRYAGWNLILTMAVYETTGEPYYLNAARIIVERVLERQTEKPAHEIAGGGWRRVLVPNHCRWCEPACHGNAGFMVGVLLSGLKLYHQATGDERVARSLHLGSRFLIDDQWNQAKRGFHYTSCPKIGASPWWNFLLFDGMAYSYRLTGDKELAKVLSLGTSSGLGVPVWSGGKNFTQYIRNAPHFLELLAELHENPLIPIPQFTYELPLPLSGNAAVKFDASASVAPKGTTPRFRWDFGDGKTGTGTQVEHTYPRGGEYQVVLELEAGQKTDTTQARIDVLPTALMGASKDETVLVEAEKFSAQGGGEVKVPSGRKGASGHIITAWHANVGHWLEWKLAVPATGRYRLILKYCTDSKNTRRDLRIDGQFPAESCKQIVFPRTGGFSISSDNWRYFTLGGDKAPVVLELTKGAHTLRMTNQGDGLALDWLVLLRK